MGLHEIDNKYLGYFDKEEDADKYLEELIDWYQTQPPETRPSINELVSRERNRGINIHYTQVYRLIKRNDILIPKDFKKVHKHQKRKVTVNVPAWLKRVVSNYPFSNSDMIVWGWKIITGHPITDMITVFFGDHKNAIFVQKVNQIEVAITNDFDQSTIKMIKGLVNSAKDNGGLQFIKRYAQNSGLLYFGGDEPDVFEISSEDSDS